MIMRINPQEINWTASCKAHVHWAPERWHRGWTRPQTPTCLNGSSCFPGLHHQKNTKEGRPESGHSLGLSQDLSLVTNHHRHGAAVGRSDIVQPFLFIQSEPLHGEKLTFFCIFMTGCISSTAIFLVLGSSRMVKVLSDCISILI